MEALIADKRDGAWCHAAFRESRGYKLALLFVIDEEDVIRWVYVSPIGINPGGGALIAAELTIRRSHCAWIKNAVTSTGVRRHRSCSGQGWLTEKDTS